MTIKAARNDIRESEIDHGVDVKGFSFLFHIISPGRLLVCTVPDAKMG